jgi:hypothetical protein
VRLSPELRGGIDAEATLEPIAVHDAFARE